MIVVENLAAAVAFVIPTKGISQSICLQRAMILTGVSEPVPMPIIVQQPLLSVRHQRNPKANFRCF